MSNATHAPERPASACNTSKSEDESLSTLLNVKQRAELTLLLAAATTAMRQTIEANFEIAVQQSIETRSTSDAEWNPNSKIVQDVKSDKEMEDIEKKRLIRGKEPSIPALMELKSAALGWFDDWRTSMIGRVGEVVNSREQAKKQLHEVLNHPETVSTTAKAAGPQAIAWEKEVDHLHSIYPPIQTQLVKLDERVKLLTLHSILLILLSLEHYSSPSRVLLLYVASSLDMTIPILNEDEENTARSLLEAAKELSGAKETQKKADVNATSRKWKVGLASVAGAAVVGLTGGLAAPLVAAGVGTVMGGLGLGATAAAGYLGAVAGSSVIVGGLFGAYGGRMTGQMMDAYAKEVTDFAFVPIHPDPAKKYPLFHRRGKSDEEAGREENKSRRLRVTVVISGWLTEKEQIVTPWKVLGTGTEVFALRFELEALLKLGNSISAMVSSYAWGYAKKEIIKRTIVAELSAALWPLGLLKISRIVDNPFSVAKSRADKAGELLADALINRAQGERPVTLIGYSLGGRVIFRCLKELAKRKAFGLVESAVIMGGPLPSDSADWRAMRSVVSGRLVNVFSDNDYVLGFLYRTSSIQLEVAGLQKVEDLPGVENVDVSDIISGHLRYRHLVGSIMKRIGFEDLNLAEIQAEEEMLRVLEEEEDKRKQKEQNDAEDDPDTLERKVEQKTDMSLMQRSVEFLHISSNPRKEQRQGKEQDDKPHGEERSYLNMEGDKWKSLTGL